MSRQGPNPAQRAPLLNEERQALGIKRAQGSIRRLRTGFIHGPIGFPEIEQFLNGPAPGGKVKATDSGVLYTLQSPQRRWSSALRW